MATSSSTNKNITTGGLDKERVMIAYFVDWSVYQRNYQVPDLPYDKLTHVMYSFSGIDWLGGKKRGNGEVTECFPGLTDPEAAFQTYGNRENMSTEEASNFCKGTNKYSKYTSCLPWPGTKGKGYISTEGKMQCGELAAGVMDGAPGPLWEDSDTALNNKYPRKYAPDPNRVRECQTKDGGSLYGQLGSLSRVRSWYHPHIKLLVSIGGWTLSDKHSQCVRTKATREQLVGNAIAMWVWALDFDGLDYDWEYPVEGGESFADRDFVYKIEQANPLGVSWPKSDVTKALYHDHGDAPNFLHGIQNNDGLPLESSKNMDSKGKTLLF